MKQISRGRPIHAEAAPLQALGKKTLHPIVEAKALGYDLKPLRGKCRQLVGDLPGIAPTNYPKSCELGVSNVKVGKRSIFFART
jgi:hypothetical protein